MKTQNPTTRIVYFECDITIKDELEATFNSIVEIFQQVDILINAAGIFNDKNIQQTFKVNVVRIWFLSSHTISIDLWVFRWYWACVDFFQFGMIYSTMLGMGLMCKEKRNSSTDAIIINIASLVGLDPFHLLPIYTASKHAIVGFSRAYSVKSQYLL